MFSWGGGGNYAYVCARVKAKKSLLLTKDNYPKLLMMDINEIGRFLGETQYQVEMAELASRYAGVDLIELATSRNLARVLTQILDFSTGELREMLTAYLNRWDFWNLKTIIRGKHFGASHEEIREDLVAAGELDMDDLNHLLSLETTMEVLEEGMRMEEIMLPEEVVSAFEKEENLAPLEDHLDKLYYTRLLERIRPTTKPKRRFLSFVMKEIDVTNLGTLLKLKAEGIPMERMLPYFVEGGDMLDIKMLEGLASAENLEQLVDELTRFRFYEHIKDGLEKVKKTGSLTEVMLDLQRYLAEEASKFSNVYPLSILPVLDFMMRKKIEVDNIRIIARGKESGLDMEVIRKLLVI